MYIHNIFKYSPSSKYKGFIIRCKLVYFTPYYKPLYLKANKLQGFHIVCNQIAKCNFLI